MIATPTRTRNRTGGDTPLLTPVTRWTAEQWASALARAQQRRLKATFGFRRVLGPDRTLITWTVSSVSGREPHAVQAVFRGEVAAIACDCRLGYQDVAPCQHMAAALWINSWHLVPQLPAEDRWLCPHCGGGLAFRRRQRNATHDWMVKCYGCYYRAWVDEHTAREQVPA